MRDIKEWLVVVEQHYQDTGKSGGNIVLFPRYRPDLCMQLADHLGLDFYDYRTEEMQQLGADAGTISLDQLEKTLRRRAEMGGIVSHNVEALLCVKPESERRAWLRSFLDAADWPNPVYLPLTVFQSDVADEHSRVCDLELLKMPAERLASAAQADSRMKYDITL